MLTVRSTFHTTAIVPADSQGPYTVNAGSPVVLSAGNTNPAATFEWDLGDGAVANTASVVHAYADDGLYVAKLKVKVNQPGGAVSRHFAIIQVRNVPPVVNAGPDRTVNEGDVVQFTGVFSDVEYPDTHTAIWDWGDYQKPDVGVVNETNTPPKAQGTVIGTHAWGDNGTYTVTLSVRDDDGGVGKDTATITVLNLPPTVDAGPDMYAYPCTVLTLRARFTDPGWLDTHSGTWDFGDCTLPQPAVIREKNDPPKGEGTATASHIYRQCGTYPAVCTVFDDDDGVGQDTALIRVVDVKNNGFEGGFHLRNAGSVGNHWEAYSSQIAVFGGPPPQEIPLSSGPEAFFAEEFPIHSGQRSQRIFSDVPGRFGIRQRVGANEGWDYEVTAWYNLAERSQGKARLGLDSAGGLDPNASTVIWSEGTDRSEWRQLSVRGVAPKPGYITIFLEGQAGSAASAAPGVSIPPRGECEVCFDDVALIAVQPFCLEEPKEKPKPDEKPPRTVCVDFTDMKPGPIPPQFEHRTFQFSSLDGGAQYIVLSGPPAGQPKLLLASGVYVHLPWPAKAVHVRLAAFHSLNVSALDGSGAVVDSKNVSSAQGEQVVELRGKGITDLILRGGGREAMLIEICIEPDDDFRRPRPSKDSGPRPSLVAQPPSVVPGQSIAPARGGRQPITGEPRDD